MGKLINGIKYMCIHDVDEYKKKSLNDQFYFTLRDIFWNTDSFDVMMIINNFNHMLTDGISFDSRTNTFQYTNILYQKTELKKINKNQQLLDTPNENHIIGEIDIVENTIIQYCNAITKTGPNKGKKCGCNIKIENLCNRHYNLHP